MIEQWPNQYRVENRSTHCGNDLSNRNWPPQLDTNSPQIIRVRKICLLAQRRVYPPGHKGPPLTDQCSAADHFANWFNRTQNATQPLPSEPVVADVNHP